MYNVPEEEVGTTRNGSMDLIITWEGPSRERHSYEGFSVYYMERTKPLWNAHRGPDPQTRNTNKALAHDARPPPTPCLGTWDLGRACATRSHTPPMEDGRAQGGAAGLRPEGRR